MNKQNKALYQQDVQDIRSSIRDNINLHDRSILTLSSGFLAISLVFVKDVIPNIGSAAAFWLLICAWGLFALTIITTIISFLVSNKAGEHQLELNKEFYTQDAKYEPKTNRWNKVTKRLNYLSSFVFCSGVLALFFFVSINIRSSEKMSNEKKVKVKEGQTYTEPAKIPEKPAQPAQKDSPSEQKKSE